MGALGLVKTGDQVLEALGLGEKEWIHGIKTLGIVGLVEFGVASFAQFVTQPASRAGNRGKGSPTTTTTTTTSVSQLNENETRQPIKATPKLNL